MKNKFKKNNKDVGGDASVDEKSSKDKSSKDKSSKDKSLGKKVGNLANSAVYSVKEGNYLILILVAIISVFGIIMVFSAGYYSTVNMTDPDPLYYLKRQGLFVVSGLIIMLAVSTVDYHVYARFSNLIIAISLTLLVLVFPLGTSANGATRWISIFGLTITPSELSKLAVIIFASVFLAEDPSRIKTAKGLIILFAIMGAHAALIVKQPNLSTAIVICILIGAIMLVAGLRLWWVGVAAGFMVTGYIVIMLFFKDSHWYDRLTSFADPFADSQGSGYQVSQSIIALGNGGLKGLGLGNSISKNLYLPEPQNDFILAIIGEELGFIGLLILMMFYMIFVFVLIMTAMNAKDKLGMYITTGVAVMLGIQVLINVAVCTASMPATGITLPFVSYGGSSLWIFMAAMGIVLNVSRGTKPRDLINLQRN